MPNNPKYEMLVCDVCSRWYHLSCISITSDEAKAIGINGIARSVKVYLTRVIVSKITAIHWIVSL